MTARFMVRLSFVVPAEAGTQGPVLDSRLRGNDNFHGDDDYLPLRPVSFARYRPPSAAVRYRLDNPASPNAQRMGASGAGCVSMIVPPGVTTTTAGGDPLFDQPMHAMMFPPLSRHMPSMPRSMTANVSSVLRVPATPCASSG